MLVAWPDALPVLANGLQVELILQLLLAMSALIDIGCFDQSKWAFDEESRERETRLVKNEEMRATCFSVVVFVPFGVDRGIVTSPHASIKVSVPPASTVSSSVAGLFHWNSAGLLQMWISVAGSRVHEWSNGYCWLDCGLKADE